MLFDEDYVSGMREVVDPDGSPERFRAGLRELASEMLEPMRCHPLGGIFRTSTTVSALGDSTPVRKPEKVYPNESPFFTPVMIDLRASDAVLKKAFSSWLEGVRADHPAAERPKAIYDRWARYGVLPYLDLCIWAWETETHIPDRVMSAAISHYDVGEANLRKTIAPLAEGLLSDLSELRAVASLEAAAQNPPSIAQLWDEAFNDAGFPPEDPETSED
ncbi:hypothetical protein D3C80_1346720 [compost metagenome]